MNDSESSIEQITNPHHLNETILKILEYSELSNSDKVKAEEMSPKKRNIEDTKSFNYMLMNPSTKESFEQFIPNYHHYQSRPRPNYSASLLNFSGMNLVNQVNSFANPSYRISQPLSNDLNYRGRVLIPNCQQFQSLNSFQSNFYNDTTCFTGASASTKQTEIPHIPFCEIEKFKDNDYFNSCDYRMINRAGTQVSINQIEYDNYLPTLSQNQFSLYNSHTYPQNFSASKLYQPMISYFPATQSITALENNILKTSTKKSKYSTSNYELLSTEELITYIPYLSKEQLGCRFLQDKIEKIPSFAEAIVFPSIYLNILEIINDQFGNYLIQKLMDYTESKTLNKIVTIVSPLINLKILSSIYDVSTNQYGTRVVQKLIEKLNKSKDVIQVFIKTILPHIQSFIINPNAYHVILKSISVFDEISAIPIFTSIKKNLNEISTNKIGCCAIQKCIDNATPDARLQLMIKIVKHSGKLMFDSQGHYVLCHVISAKNQKLNKLILIDMLEEISMRIVCKHKYASVVLEKWIENSSIDLRGRVINELLDRGLFLELLLDNFGIKSRSPIY